MRQSTPRSVPEVLPLEARSPRGRWRRAPRACAGTLRTGRDGFRAGDGPEDPALGPGIRSAARFLDVRLSSCQNFLETGSRPVNERFRGPDGDPQHLADFLVIETRDVVEEERRAARGRELSDGSFELEPSKADGRNAPGKLVSQRLGPALLLRSSAAQVVEASVDREPVEPRAERRAALEAREPIVRLQKNLLKHVFRVRSVLEHPQREPEDRRAMPPVERFECLHLASSGSLDQIVVFAPLGVAVEGRWRKRTQLFLTHGTLGTLGLDHGDVRTHEPPPDRTGAARRRFTGEISISSRR